MKQEYNRLFDKITPAGSDEEFTLKVLRKAEKMKKNKKNISIKRPLISICAAVGAVTLGTVAAAASGIIDFDKIFGNIITAENEQLAEAIMGRAENVIYTVSDNDYTITLNGVTGNDNMIIANLELSRTDGTPVTDHFLNPYDENYGFTALDTCKADISMERENWLVNHNQYSINEEGNLEIDAEISSDLDISEKKITLMGKDLYPIEPYFELLEANDISMWSDNLTWVKSNMEEVTPDTSSVAYLQLDWSVEFEYYPSENAVNSLYRDNFTEEDKLMLSYGTGLYLDEGKFADIESELASIDLKCTNGTIIFKSDMTEYIDPETNKTPDILIGDEGNPIKLIRKDGSEIKAFACGAWSNPDGNSQLDIVYLKSAEGNWHSNTIAVDLSQIEAVSINGYVYKIG